MPLGGVRVVLDHDDAVLGEGPPGRALSGEPDLERLGVRAVDSGGGDDPQLARTLGIDQAQRDERVAHQIAGAGHDRVEHVLARGASGDLLGG